MSQKKQVPYILSSIRTPVAKAKGGLSHLRPDDLLALTIKSLLEKNPSIDATLIDDVIIGCAMPEGEQGMNVARISALLAGVPNTVPAVTVNRFCASGLQSISMAADRIALGEADVIIAGGVESMSRVPMGGYHYRANPSIFDDEHIGIAYGMGVTAEQVAKQWQISREEQDIFALQSHQKALKAQGNGSFTDEIVPIDSIRRTPSNDCLSIQETPIRCVEDEGPREDTSLEKLAKLSPVFAARGSVTAGNTSQMSDGAAACLVVSESFLHRYDLRPLARFCGYQVAGVSPEVMGIGPVIAVPKLLARYNMSLTQIDWIELNEAFAAQALAVTKELEMEIDKVNPLGGAIALGHPLGATGAVRTATLLHGLRRNQLKYGLVTMCIGTGMGAAGLFESV